MLAAGLMPRSRTMDTASGQEVDRHAEASDARRRRNTEALIRETVRTDLNVFEAFSPRIPAPYRDSSQVFLGNIHPVLQQEVLDQVAQPRLVALDTMNYWITGAPEELRKVLARVDVLLINDAEARQLSGEWNIVKAARAIRALGPRTLVLKKGEHGVLMFTDAGSFAAPAYPLEEVFDPTGAGDTFAGGFLGYLASVQKDAGDPGRGYDDEALRRAVVMGSTLASFCVRPSASTGCWR